MIWVAWRQQRTETLIAVAVLALLAVLFVPTGLEMASRYDDDGLAACSAAASDDACRQAIQAFSARFDSLMSLLPWLNLLPGVIGVALAAPLLLELESGTYRLAWTQSVTRRRWLAVKLGLTTLAAVLAALVMIGARDVVANAARRALRPHGERLRLRGHRRHRLRALRARRSRSRSARCGGGPCPP